MPPSSTQRTPLASAALRHAHDAALLAGLAPADGAEALAPARRSADQAWHLAGFAVECAEKATLADTAWHKALGHIDAAAAEDAWAMVAALAPEAPRLPPRPAALQGWSVQARYDQTGSVDPQRAAAAAAAAQTFALDAVAALWIGGQLRGVIDV